MGAVTVKGQVTIPKRIRDALGVKPGDRVEFELLRGGGARILPAPARSFEERLRPLIGSRKSDRSTEQQMIAMRGDPAEDPVVTLPEDYLRLLGEYTGSTPYEPGRRDDTG